MTFPECNSHCALQLFIRQGGKQKERLCHTFLYYTVIKWLILSKKKKGISATSFSEGGGVNLGDENPSPSISFYHSLKDFVTPSVIAGDIFPTERKASEGDQ